MIAVESLLNDLERSYGTESVKLSISRSWNISALAEARGESLHDYLKDVKSSV
jgi:hypothetical protein